MRAIKARSREPAAVVVSIFQHGRDIGDHAVLAQIAGTLGFDAVAVASEISWRYPSFRI